jgi:hypothetical protein
MASELRVNTITSTTGVGTVTLGSGGVSFSGTPTFNDVTLGSINSGPLAGARNCIINGNFDIWQRGTTATVTTAGSNYLTDRYIWNTQGNTTTVSRQAFTVGQTDVPYEPTYFHRIQITAAVAAQLSLEQRVEDVRTLAGQTATLSFYAKGAAAFTLNYSVAQNFGTGGSPSSGVSAGSGTVSLTTSWQKFTITFNVPSISGKTLGTNNDHFLQVVWQMPASATNTFDLAQVQLEKGSVATPFERRFIGQEIALCQRYYEIVPGTTAAWQGIWYHHRFQVQKRSTPNLSVFFGSVSGASYDGGIDPTMSFRLPAGTTTANATDWKIAASAEL